jgi:TetR/AcrR family transcriptional regulator
MQRIGLSTLVEKERNPSRTREAILDAAERLFAERGFDATSLNDVGASAGVSRGTPGYFFGSKADLYRAVLGRGLERVRHAVRSGQERALASGANPEVVLAGAVSEYFDFITSNPHFVRLMEWEALSGGHHLLQVPPHLEAAHEAVAAIGVEVGLDSTEAAQLLLSIIGLCWFPLVHSATVIRALGIDPTDPSFLADRKRHVIDLVLQGVRGRFAVQNSR